MKGTARFATTASVVFVLVAGTLSAQTVPPAAGSQSSPPNTEQAVKAAEQQLLDARRNQDKDTARRLMAESLAWVDGRGSLLSRNQLIEGTPNIPVEVIIDRVKMFDDMAVVTGSARWDNGEKVRFLEHWVNRDGSWRMYAHQGTALNPAPPVAQTPPPATAGTSGRTVLRNSAPTLRSDDERAIWKAQTDLQEAFLSGDANTWSRLTTDEFFRMEADGTERTKTEYLQAVQANAGRPKGRIDTSDVQMAVTGDTARLVMTSWLTPASGQSDPPTRVTRVFVKRNGQWQQAAVVFTRLAQ